MEKILPEIQQRRARRALSSQEIPDELLQRLLQAATLSASCFNNQPWRFVVLKKDFGIALAHARLSQGNYWAKTAPVIIGVATRPDYDCELDEGRQYALFDCGMAVQNLQIQAQHEGLVAHPIAGFKAAELKEDLGIPADHILITLVVIGYPGTDNELNDKHQELESSERVRKGLDEVVFPGTWPAQSRSAE
ncbi:MAG: nitroreductase [Spirochaetaceae bacterium]|nr:MAG: nitroreductase [Spirochaetaceae bacterium]